MVTGMLSGTVSRDSCIKGSRTSSQRSCRTGPCHGTPRSCHVAGPWSLFLEPCPGSSSRGRVAGCCGEGSCQRDFA
ncbi:hypothetical protein M885DRAFT_518252 [Pelagophyceae sp. CCMP2097]|nr:hypothetical protein M885DRAFT_518252 [Pelagophyceae sp. CCMP2097]